MKYLAYLSVLGLGMIASILLMLVFVSALGVPGRILGIGVSVMIGAITALFILEDHGNYVSKLRY